MGDAELVGDLPGRRPGFPPLDDLQDRLVVQLGFDVEQPRHFLHLGANLGLGHPADRRAQRKGHVLEDTQMRIQRILLEHEGDIAVGRRVAGHIRVAFEVGDSRATASKLAAAGATVIAEPTVTPWNSLNARLEAPAGLQLTLFTELGEADPD